MYLNTASRCVLLPLLLAMVSCAAKDPPVPVLGAPDLCKEIRGAYCVQDKGIIVEVHNNYSKDLNRLVVYDNWWKDTPLVILEPKTCRAGRSDKVQNLGVERSDSRISLRIRLREDGSCDLNIQVGGKGVDSAGSGYFTALTEIRACERPVCEGPVIGRDLHELLRW